MAKINKIETIKRIMDDAGIQTSTDDVPKELASKIVPVLISNPDLKKYESVIESAGRNTTGSSVIYTTPIDKDFYLTDVYLQNQSDSTADNTIISLSVTQKGKANKFIIYMRKLTTTAFDHMISRKLDPPIRLERGSTITSASTFTAGASETTGSIIGFIVE